MLSERKAVIFHHSLRACASFDCIYCQSPSSVWAPRFSKDKLVSLAIDIQSKHAAQICDGLLTDNSFASALR